MALSGLEIFKLLPKTNCGECGVPTCLAFAMKLAQKKAELDQCPYASDEAKAALGAASEPPIRLIKIGSSPPLQIGDETVMFRHEKTFYHQPGLGIELHTSENQENLRSQIKQVEDYQIERVGEMLKADLFLVTHDSDETQDLLATLNLIKQVSTKGVILNSRDKKALRAGLELLQDESPAILLSQEVEDEDIKLAQDYEASLILTSHSLENLGQQAEKALQAGVKNIILNPDSDNIGQLLQYYTITRRSALKQNFKPFGFPLFTLLPTDNQFDLSAKAAVVICKYSSIVIFPKFDPALFYPFFTLRQNIYTDPQKPIQVDPRVYPIGEPTPESPVFVTTNFSLTYFIVAGEIENTGVSAHLLVCDTEGQSVLTAWAAGKFNGETIAKFIKDNKLEEKIKTRKIIIPGYVAQISGDLEENLPGWEVIVGCQEASDIPSFVKNVNLT